MKHKRLLSGIGETFGKFFKRFSRSYARNLRFAERNALPGVSYVERFFVHEETRNDKWIYELLDYEGGFFVEAGALDGVVKSSTYAIEKLRHWKGLLVEPDTRFSAESIAANRPASVVEKCCLSDHNGSVTYSQSGIPQKSGIKEELIATEAYMLARTGHTYGKDEWRTLAGYEDRVVSSRTLESLLEQHNAPRTVDYIALDMEGSEYTVLSVFPWDKYHVRALSIEDVRCNDLLESVGFVRVENGHNERSPWEQYFVQPDLVERCHALRARCVA